MTSLRGPNPECKTGAPSSEKRHFFTADNSHPEIYSRSGALCNFLYSPDGKVLAQVIREKSAAAQPTTPGAPVVESRYIELYDVNPANSEPKLLHRIPPNPNSSLAGVEDYIYFSPLSRYLVTWQPVDKVVKCLPDGSFSEGNLKIWDVQTGQILISWVQHARQAWPVCRWTVNERILMRLDQGQLHAFDWYQFTTGAPIPESAQVKLPGATVTTADGNTEAKQATASDGFSSVPIRRETLHTAGITDFSVSHGAIATFVPGKKGLPARILVFRLNDGTELLGKKAKGVAKADQKEDEITDEVVDTQLASPPPSTLFASQNPSSQKSFFKADEVQMVWHNRGIGVLVLASTLMDASGKSYYGDTSLYYLQADGKFDCNVILEKKGPIHHVAWNPKGNDFAVVYGYMPAKITLFNRKCKPLGHLGSGSRNTLVWSPHGRILCVGGFGALSGEMDFWDTSKLELLGTCTAYCSSNHQWSPDGRYLMANVLWPRMRVDNGIKIFSISGQLVWSSTEKELWQAQWQQIALDKPEYQPGQPPQHTYPRPPHSIVMKDIYPDVDFNKVDFVPVNRAPNTADHPVPGVPPTVNAANFVPRPLPGASRAGSTQNANSATAAPGKYRHPHWSGSTRSNLLGHQIEGPQRITPSPPGSAKVSQTTTATATAKLPVGYVPANTTGLSKSALKNKAKREKRKVQQQQQQQGNGQTP